MNILIFSTFDNEGGAAIAARRLCRGLIELNQDAVMIVRNKDCNNPHIYKASCIAPQFQMEKEIFQNIQKFEIDQNRTYQSDTWFSFPYPGYDFSKIEGMANFEIINLHWVAGLQSVETISTLLQLGKPVVWTLHDENPYTGGCHYTAGCTKYREDCKDCSQLNDNRYQIPYYNLKNKLNLWNKNLTIVTPSKWLAACAKTSRAFKDLRVEVIPNSLETDIFKPKEKKIAKEKLGISPHTFTLLFGARDTKEKRKGFFKLLEAMKYCLQDNTFKNLAKKNSIKILTFGIPQKDLEKLPIKIKSIGYVNGNEKLSTIYSASDIFILPSLEDNLPNTVLESMACATPVIGFQVGGLPDMIQHGVTGYMAPCFDTQKLGELILKLLFDKDKKKQMSQNSRQLIERKFKLQDQAKNYLELFHDLLKNKEIIRKTKRKSKDILSQGGEIILNDWESHIQKDFFDVYRKWGLHTFITQNMGIGKFKRLIKFPLKKIRGMLRKVRKRINRGKLF